MAIILAKGITKASSEPFTLVPGDVVTLKVFGALVRGTGVYLQFEIDPEAVDEDAQWDNAEFIEVPLTRVLDAPGTWRVQRLPGQNVGVASSLADE